MHYDVILVTDGSGHVDGLGGYAAMAYTPDKAIKIFRMAALSGTTVDRAEFMGALEGLNMCLEIWNAMPQRLSSDPSQSEARMKVLWISDRESMILSAKNVQERSNAPDLWARYAWYEGVMDITPTFEKDPEKTRPEFAVVDMQASTGREVMKLIIWEQNLPRQFV